MIVGALLLLLAALVCVWAELFVPTHGILALCAAVLALVSVIFAARASPTLGVFFGIGVVLFSPVVFYWAARLYPHTPVGRRVVLKGPPAGVNEPFADERARLTALIGKRGITMTPLRPSGIVDLEGERIDCVSESVSIPADTAVEVLRVTGLKVIVKAVNLMCFLCFCGSLFVERL